MLNSDFKDFKRGGVKQRLMEEDTGGDRIELPHTASLKIRILFSRMFRTAIRRF